MRMTVDRLRWERPSEGEDESVGTAVCEAIHKP